MTYSRLSRAFVSRLIRLPYQLPPNTQANWPRGLTYDSDCSQSNGRSLSGCQQTQQDKYQRSTTDYPDVDSATRAGGLAVYDFNLAVGCETAGLGGFPSTKAIQFPIVPSASMATGLFEPEVYN